MGDEIFAVFFIHFVAYSEATVADIEAEHGIVRLFFS